MTDLACFLHFLRSFFGKKEGGLILYGLTDLTGRAWGLPHEGTGRSFGEKGLSRKPAVPLRSRGVLLTGPREEEPFLRKDVQ